LSTADSRKPSTASMRWPTDGTRDLARLLADPESAHALSPLQWEGVVTAGRETTLLGTLWHRLNQAQCQTAVPQAVAWHLRGAQRVADRQAEALRWELRELQDGMLQRMAAPSCSRGPPTCWQTCPTPGAASATIST